MLNIFGDVRRCSGEAGTTVQNSRFFGSINASAKSISINKFKMTGRAGPRLEAPTKPIALSFKGRLFMTSPHRRHWQMTSREKYGTMIQLTRIGFLSRQISFEKTECNAFSCLSWLYRYLTVKSSVTYPRPHCRFMESRYMTRTRRFYQTDSQWRKESPNGSMTVFHHLTMSPGPTLRLLEDLYVYWATWLLSFNLPSRCE